MKWLRKSDIPKIYLPGDVWILAFSSMVWNIGGFISGPFQSIFFYDIGTPVGYIGVLAAVSSIVMAISLIIGGYLADIWGRKRIITMFSFIAAGSSALYFFVNSWPFLFIPIIMGSLSGIYSPAFNAMLNDSMKPRDRPIGFASFTLLTVIPSLFAPYIGGVLMEHLGPVEGLKIGFLLAGMLGLAAVTWRAVRLDETYKPKFKKLSFKKFTKGIITENIHALKSASRNAKILLVYTATASMAAGFSTVYISIYLVKNAKLLPTQYGLLVGLSSLATIFLLLPTVTLIKKLGLKRAAVISSIFAPVSMLVFVSANGMNDLITWSITGGISGALLSPTIQSMEGNATTKQIRGRIMGLFILVPLLASVPAQIISGYLYSISPLLTFIVSIPFYITSIFILSKMDMHRHPKESGLVMLPGVATQLP
ncbi:MAG: MFS transporter [Candidatus Marsarchaeota archaeon]|nr:MFS transporter [Candidatus Marsarchaeota archaeon]